MPLSLLTKLTVQGIVKRRTVYFPYFLALVLIMSLDFIMISLITNEYVQSRHATLPTIIIMGVFFTSLLAVIFILYANNFIQRQRRMEFALYTVLGLEDKHIRSVILFEQLLTWVIGSLASIGVGYALGNVMFIVLNRLIQDTGADLMDYPFSPLAAIGTIIIIGGITFIIFLINSIRLARLNPSELLSQTHAGEAEPKSRWFILLIGLITLVAGYYVALTTTDVLDALLKVFIAIFLVIIGTYALLTSLSIIFLKRMKRNKKYYYQPTHFLSISGMLYRMKANATSLAGIAVLCTGIVLTLGTTLTLYIGMEDQVEQMSTHDIELRYMQYADGASPENAEAALTNIMEELQTHGDIKDVSLSRSAFVTAIYQNKSFQPMPAPSETTEGEELLPTDFAYIIGVPLEDFNQLNGENIHLEPDEVLFTTTTANIQQEQDDTLQFADKEYQVQQISSSYMPLNYIGQIAYVVFPTIEEVESLLSTFPNYISTGERSEALLEQAMVFNAVDDSARESIEAAIPTDTIFDQGDLGVVRVVTRTTTSQELYTMNGGLLFLGIIVGTVLIIGTVLMLYFKQVSEGYQDQGKFQIMRKVGLPDHLIKQTIRSQIFWIFALPIMIAVIHSLFASKIMFNLLGLLAVNNITTFMIGYGSVLGVFVVVYLLFYLITSQVYYRIIHQ